MECSQDRIGLIVNDNLGMRCISELQVHVCFPQPHHLTTCCTPSFQPRRLRFELSYFHARQRQAACLYLARRTSTTIYIAIPAIDLCLLALDSGGVYSLSSLIILRHLIATIDLNTPPKPYNYFDIIDSISISGLIAIILGYLYITIDEYIDAYTILSNRVFEKKSYCITIKGKLQGQFDGAKLKRIVKTIIVNRNLGEDILLKDPNSLYKV